MTQYRIGEVMILGSSLIFGLFPIITHYATVSIPPIFFAAVSMLIASVPLGIIFLIKGNMRKLLDPKLLPYLITITFLIVIIPAPLIFLGASITSSINTAILLKSELLFALLLSSVFLRHHLGIPKILSSLLIFAGSIIILFDGSVMINKGDLLVLLGAFFYPIGNLFVQKTLKKIDSSGILFFRSIVGGLVLLFLSFAVEGTSSTGWGIIQDHPQFLFWNAIFLWALSKIMVYEGLKRLDLVKATSLMMSETAFSLLYAIVLFKEFPSVYQWLGFFVVMLGVYFSTRSASSYKSLGTR